MIVEMTEAERAAHVASYAIPALLSDEDLCAAWRAHWREFDRWPSAGEWFDRHCELHNEANLRGITLSVKSRISV